MYIIIIMYVYASIYILRRMRFKIMQDNKIYNDKIYDDYLRFYILIKKQKLASRFCFYLEFLLEWNIFNLF